MEENVKLIKSVAEIDYSSNSLIRFLATVTELRSTGDGEKTPFNMVLKLEESGETIEACSWKFEYLDTIKTLVLNDSVFEFTGITNIYNGKEQIRVGNVRDAGMRSSRKIIKLLNIEEIKSKIEEYINAYVPKKSVYRAILNELVLNNPNFFKWPAATKVHHAYPGGLAKHSLGVCEIAVQAYKTHQTENLSSDLLVTGALLHDIGKLYEYREDGTIGKYGDLIGHPVLGVEMVIDACHKLGIDHMRETRVVLLKNVILSHHGELQFGSPVQPATLEAAIIAKADATDAVIEAGDKALDNTDKGQMSDRIIALNGSKIIKWL